MTNKVFLEKRIRFLIQQDQAGRLSEALAAYFEVKRLENGSEEIILLEELPRVSSITAPPQASKSTTAYGEFSDSGTRANDLSKLDA